MPVKIRLQRHGRKKRPFYFIVAADSKSPRDGRFIERLGSYDPTTVPATIILDGDKALSWLHNGAEPTDTVRAILSYKGVLYKKHLVRGLKKGALSEEQVEQLHAEYLKNHEGKVEGHVESVAKAKEDARLKRNADEAAKRAKALSAAAEAEAAAIAEAAAEEAAANAEAATEEAPAEEVAAEEVATEEVAAEEAPAAEAPAEEAPAAEAAAEESEEPKAE
jgi:small subunit ribosomal protein S16